MNDWADRMDRADLIPNWDVINEELLKFTQLDTAAVARKDQVEMAARKFLSMTAIDITDQRDLYCLLAGFAMVDTLAREWFETDETIAVRFIATLCNEAIMPLLKATGALA